MSKSVRKIGTNNQLFSLEFPVTMPAVIKNPINIVKLNFKPEMRSTLVDIILKHGDEQNHSSNVKADMTDWFMHHHYAEFKQLALHAEVQSKLMTKDPVPLFTNECWGAVYHKGEETKAHSHWGNLWSWCYYLEVPQDAPPIRFLDTYVPDLKKITELDVYPEEDDLLIFSSWHKHCVPKSESNDRRIMIAGNVQIDSGDGSSAEPNLH